MTRIRIVAFALAAMMATSVWALDSQEQTLDKVNAIFNAKTAGNEAPEVCPREKGIINHYLWEAVKNGLVERVKLLIRCGADANTAYAHNGKDTVLTLAARNGYVDIVSILIANGADVNKVMEHAGGTSALMSASSYGHTDTAELLLAKGADVEAGDNDGHTALMYASAYGHTNTAKLLLAKGADMEARDNDGYTALMFGVHNGHTDTAELLLAKGADVEARNNNGDTALIVAATLYYNANMIKLLIAKGADVNAVNPKNGRTALLEVAGATEGCSPVAKALIDVGADVNARDYLGRTALTIACQSKNLSTAYLLLEAGAKHDRPKDCKPCCKKQCHKQ
ncbi:ankyrin repeat domain-containing protein [Elusimicrobiota bacterium]